MTFPPCLPFCARQSHASLSNKLYIIMAMITAFTSTQAMRGNPSPALPNGCCNRPLAAMYSKNFPPNARKRS